MSGITSTAVAKRFGDKLVLDSLSFEAPRGAVTLIVGRNGAGKTTWVRLALGMARPTSGSIDFDGSSIDQARSSVAVLLDEPPVYPHLSGQENLRHLSGIRRFDSATLKRVCEMLNLDRDFLRMRAGSYSYGQRRRLSFAAALLRRPSYIILDEPTVGLDPLAWQAVSESLQALKAEGCAVVLTGQDFTEVESIVDKVVLLSDGTAVFDGPIERFVTRRPPRVRVITAARELCERFPDAVCVDRDGENTVYEIPCQDEQSAQRTLEAIIASGVRVRGVSIVYDTLQEAFLSTIQEAGEGKEHASDG